MENNEETRAKYSDLIEEHRDWNTQWHDWSESTVDLFCEDMDKEFINVASNDVNFSGFWSQGDGACFTGHITDAVAFWKKHNKGEFADEFPKMALMTDICDADVFCPYIVDIGSHRYNHSNTKVVETSTPSMYDYNKTDNTLIEVLFDNIDKIVAEEVTAYDNWATTVCRQYMDELYHKLEKEYEYLTSDEVVFESLLANDMIEELETEAA